MENCKIDFSNARKKFDYCNSNRICSVENCNNPAFCKGYCTKHYAQIQHHGKIINTIFDKNEIIEHDDYAEIIVKDKKGDTKGIAIIDLDDASRCKRFKWGMYANGYFYGNINKSLRIRLHRYIMNVSAYDGNTVVDHIDRNPANNRKNNLRIVTPSENNKNRESHYSKTINTDNDNIYFDKKHKTHYGRYSFKGTTYNTHYYKNREDALNEMNNIKRKLMKEINISFTFNK